MNTDRNECRTCYGFLSVLLAVALLSACASNINRGSFGAFKRSLNDKSHGYAVVPDPTGNAPSKFVERFEVRSGDCSYNTGWSDCENDRERSELTETEKNYSGSEWWYGWHLYLPPDYPLIAPAKTALAQFHQHDAPPAFMFQNQSGGYWIDRNFGSTTDLIPLLSHEEMIGRWNRIEVHARWDKTNGFFRVYVNGALKYDFNGTTMTASSSYFKYGVYRSFVSRYKNGQPAPTQVALFANVTRSKTREGLNGSND